MTYFFLYSQQIWPNKLLGRFLSNKTAHNTKHDSPSSYSELTWNFLFSRCRVPAPLADCQSLIIPEKGWVSNYILLSRVIMFHVARRFRRLSYDMCRCSRSVFRLMLLALTGRWCLWLVNSRWSVGGIRHSLFAAAAVGIIVSRCISPLPPAASLHFPRFPATCWRRKLNFYRRAHPIKQPTQCFILFLFALFFALWSSVVSLLT